MYTLIILFHCYTYTYYYVYIHVYIVGFWLGGVVSVPCYQTFGRLAIIINLFIFFMIGLSYSVMIVTKSSVPLWRAVLGLYVITEKRTHSIHKVTKTVHKTVNKKFKQIKNNVKEVVDHTYLSYQARSSPSPSSKLRKSRSFT